MSLISVSGGLGVALFLSGCAGLALQQKNLLSVLLYLEVCNIGTFVMLTVSLGLSTSPSVLMIFLCLTVCEAGVGLAVLVMVARSHGNDYVSSVGVLFL
nr:NADH dehydrogenase subunit 4L [Nipponacmea sp. JM-2022]